MRRAAKGPIAAVIAAACLAGCGGGPERAEEAAGAGPAPAQAQVAPGQATSDTGREATAPAGDTGRSPALAVDPTGRSESLAAVTRVEHPRPDGSVVELIRIPGGAVELGGERRAVPTFWVEASPATVRAYAPFVRDRVAAGDAVEPLLPQAPEGAPWRLAHVVGRQSAALLMHVGAGEGASGGDLPHEVLAPIPAAAAEAYLRWAGVEPLGPAARERAWLEAAIPTDDLRGGLFLERRAAGD